MQGKKPTRNGFYILYSEHGKDHEQITQDMNGGATGFNMNMLHENQRRNANLQYK